jgi:membrane-associated phospholipid phosphatase
VSAFTIFTSLLCLAAVSETRANDAVETAGNVLLYVLPASAAGLALSLKDGEGAWQLAESGALTLGVTFGLKYAIHAQRPSGGSHSFPSGHTAASFFPAEFLRKRYGWEFGLPAYILGSAVAYSRVESREHYLRDVAGGAAIGMLSSYLLTTPYKGWRVQLEVDGGNRGFKIGRAF